MYGNRRAVLAVLEVLSLPDLRTRYREVCGQTSRSNNRQWLVRRIAWRLQAQAEGDLTERARRRAGELAQDDDLRARPPAEPTLPIGHGEPRVVGGRMRRLADDRVPIPGTVLSREYGGVEHRVTVVESGFEHEGKVYRSLSAVAKAITGGHWNGFYFFGLDGRTPGDRRGAREGAA